MHATNQFVRNVVGVTGSARDVGGLDAQVVEAAHGVNDRAQVVQALKRGLAVPRSISVAIILDSMNRNRHVLARTRKHKGKDTW
jgi:hypothetical protein